MPRRIYRAFSYSAATRFSEGRGDEGDPVDVIRVPQSGYDFPQRAGSTLDLQSVNTGMTPCEAVVVE